MALSFSLRKFPVSGEIKGQCGLPFGCVVQPFAQFDKLPLDTPLRSNLDSVARCSECYAYINKYCLFERGGWVCSLCGNYNDYHRLFHNKYVRESTRSKLPELQDSIVEIKCSAKGMLLEAEEAGDPEEKAAAIPDNVELVGRPVYVAVVDLACGEEFLELVKSSLLAALEALPPVALFGIISFCDKIGLHDVQGKVPIVKYVPLVSAAEGQSPTRLELKDALALEDLLAPVGQFKDSMYAALEALEPMNADGAAAGGRGKRGFGGTIQAVLRYLSGLAAMERVGQLLDPEEAASLAGPTQGSAENGGPEPSFMIGYTGARVMCFLAGAPNHGPGRVERASIPSGSHGRPRKLSASDAATALGCDPSFPYNPATASSPSRPPPSQPAEDQVAVDLGGMSIGGGSEPHPADVVVDPRCALFYADAAAAAAALGIAVDLYAISNEVIGLECLEPLASSSGGQLCWYPGPEGAALPQDVYRRLATHQARSCRLRLRTSPEFKVQRGFGHLVEDQQYENLYHVVSCGAHDCVAFDFEFASSAGFLDHDDCPPTLQLAFQYTALLPHKPPAADQDSPQAPKWLRMERRMRIHTVQVAVARGPKDLYAYADTDAVLSLLMHKVVRASQEDGVEEARLLLQDWLVVLLAHYNANLYPGRIDEADMVFEACPALQPLPRLVYVMLQSPLLANDQSRRQHHPDLRCFLQNLWALLPPADLARAVYPVLSSWSSPEQPAYPKHSLSRAALLAASEPIFLLDSFTSLIVYYTEDCPADIPCPPSQSSKLRQTINHLRQNRIVAPQVKVIRAGVDDASPFTDHLIEEADAQTSGPAESGLGTFVQFLDNVEKEVKSFLQSR